MSLHVGESVGDYRVIGIIGAGGMGQVFQVEHKITKRREAMKVLIADLADETQVQRFKREIEVQARLNHPNIAAVHNAFRLKDRMVLVLEFVEGQTLESLLKQSRPPLETAIDYVRQTLSALSYAHQNGVIHRDVSPANLMITETGLVKLMDFGVAKSLGDLRLTNGGSMIGSLYYMAPEQVKGAVDPDPRSDIYSAGVILYEVVTGKRPFDYEDQFSLMVAQVEEEPLPPSQIDAKLPAKLDDIILKALAKDASQRYTSAKDFLTALEIIKQPVAAFAPTRAAGTKRRKFSTATAGVAALLICALAGIGALTSDRFRQPPPPTAAVSFAVPSAPENLTAIPPAPPASPHPDPVGPDQVQMDQARQALATPSIEKPLKAFGKTRTETARREAKPVETTSVGARGAELEPPAQQAEAQQPAQPEPEAQPTEPKKGRFWSKLNPFRGKTNSPKKKKEDSALRAPGDAPPAGRQE